MSDPFSITIQSDASSMMHKDVPLATHISGLLIVLSEN